MMEMLIQFTQENAHLAHLIYFSLLMLAGCNVPISEDILVLSAGYISATLPSNQIFSLYLVIFLGCWLSAWEAFFIGHYFGPKLYQMRWFKRFITPEKVSHLHRTLDKFGIFTFIVGRFIPGGFRNLLFMGTGLSKMKFSTFIARDFPGCLLSSLILFSLGFSFEKNADKLSHFFAVYKIATISIFLLTLTSFLTITLYRRSKKLAMNKENL